MIDIVACLITIIIVLPYVCFVICEVKINRLNERIDVHMETINKLYKRIIELEQRFPQEISCDSMDCDYDAVKGYTPKCTLKIKKVDKE